MTDKADAPIIKIHFVYVTIILSIFIIGLATNHWTTLKGFPEYLNVAATFTSLVLGILAIIYSFVSTGAMNQFLGSIQNSSSTISQIASEMRDALVAGQQIQARSDRRSEELHKVTAELAVGLASLEESSKAIAGKVDTTQSQLISLQESLATATAPPPSASVSEATPLQWTSEQIATVLKKVSQYGLLTLKGICLAKERSLYLDVEKIDSKELYMYGYGYLLALQVAELIKLEYPEEKDQAHAVRLGSGAPGIEEAIDAEWNSRIKNSKKKKYLLAQEPFLEGALHDGSKKAEDSAE